jgi:hypothetical protein
MHTRLLAGNLAQLICTLGFAFFGVFIAIDIVHEMYPSEVVPQVCTRNHCVNILSSINSPESRNSHHF